MGCVSSKNMPSIPGLASTPCVQYAENRRKACKDLVSAQEGLLAASKESSEAMHAVGQSLKVFCASTNIFENPTFNPLPPLLPIAAAPAAVPALMPAPALAPADVATAPADMDTAPAPVPAAVEAAAAAVPYPPVPPPASPPPLPEDPSSLQLAAVGGKHPDKKQRMEDLARQIDANFTEIGSMSAKAMHDANHLGINLSKSAMPALTLANSTMPDGKLEPIADSLHKLLLWETHLKEDVKAMETARSTLQKSDKKLSKSTTKAAKDPNADLRKVRASQGKVNDASAKLETSTKAIQDTFLSVEQFKAEVIYPQFCRLFPLLSDSWGKVASLASQQQKLAADMAALGLVAASPPVLTEDAALMTSAATDIHGEATKGNHEATKALDQAFAKWAKAFESNVAAQKKCAQGLQNWIKASQSIPGDFPKPDPAVLASIPTGPMGKVNVEHTINTMAVDWEKTMDELPHAFPESMVVISRALKEAYDLQVKGHKEHKKLDAAKKELLKAETKLADAKKKEDDLHKKTSDLKIDPTKAKEHDKAVLQAKKAGDDVITAQGALEGSKMKYKTERETYALALYDECNAAGKALQDHLVEVFQNWVGYATASSAGFKKLQTQYASWMGMHA